MAVTEAGAGSRVTAERAAPRLSRATIRVSSSSHRRPSPYYDHGLAQQAAPYHSKGWGGVGPLAWSSPNVSGREGLQSGEECREYVEALDGLSGAIPEDDRKLLPLLHRSLAQRVKEAVVNPSGPRATPRCVARYTSARRCLPSCRYGHLSPSACADLCC
jgi:hypothetical protein